MPSLFQRLSALWKKPQPTAPAAVPQVAPSVREAVAPKPEIVGGQAQFLNEELIYTVLRTCHDPEIPLNIVDLGLIYDVRVAGECVDVKMTLTTQGCGMGGYISREAEEKILSLPGVSEAKVEIVWEPPWTPEMISLEGRKTLGLPE
jgi:metal-sulfur cluster biosynthetic enzyme